MDQTDCLIHATDLFQELDLWRAESQNKFSTLINSQQTRLLNGIKGYMREFKELQILLLNTTNEKKILIDTVANLNDELRKLRSELTISRSLPRSAVENNSQDHGKEDVKETIALNQDEGQCSDIERLEQELLSKNYEKLSDEFLGKECSKTEQDEDVLDFENEPLLDLGVRSNQDVSTISEISDDVVIENEHEDENGELELDQEISSKQSNYTSQSQQKWPEAKLQEDIHQNRSKMKCELCTFTTATRTSMNQHINRVHNKTYPCKVCKNIFRDKWELEDHLYNIHDDKRMFDSEYLKFACEQCPYKAANNSALKTHVKLKHEKIKNFACLDCDYATGLKVTLMYHIDTVHKGNKKFKCDKCSYSSALKGNLKKHTESVHNTEEKKFKCGICTFKSNFRSALKCHVKKVHLVTL